MRTFHRPLRISLNMRMLLAGLMLLSLTAAPRGQAGPDLKLREVLIAQDRAMFDAFNRRDLERIMSLFDPTLEFFHDKDGLQDHAQVRKALASLFANPAAPRRELIADSIRVFPIPNYGALMVGQHRFCHDERGTPVCGAFEFSHVWQLKDGGWKVTRVLSYDHR